MKRYPWVKIHGGARPPIGPDGRALLHKLNHVGWVLRRPVMVTSGRRTPREQHYAYMDFLRGGVLAAPCCSRHYLHSWASCLRQCASNHCRSRAADCIIRLPSGDWVNIGEDHAARAVMRRVNLCLPVGSGETWHVEIGESWRS